MQNQLDGAYFYEQFLKIWPFCQANHQNIFSIFITVCQSVLLGERSSPEFWNDEDDHNGTHRN